jgi:hypothetical protein
MPPYLIHSMTGRWTTFRKATWQQWTTLRTLWFVRPKAAGVWIFGGGVLRQQATIVATNGTSSQGPFPETKAVVGGFSIIEVPTRDEALAWAARIAKSCRCAQEVREIMYDPES